MNSDGAKAAKEKDFVTAEAKYAEAMKAAADSQQKCKAVLGKFQALLSRKKYKDAEKFALEAVEDEMLKPQEARQILNTLAGSMLCWNKREDYALNLLRQAENCECPKNSNAYFTTYYYMAILYGKKKQPQTAIEVMEKVLQVSGMHPANLFNAHMVMGKSYEQLNEPGKALEHYKSALENGKKVKYKFNYSAAEKAIERLSK
ncbi:MAG: hypothetical protein J5806_12825 [Lentisphaeria bacterium]|nr:hypothetical protein [Lentisphaeria bacterium]